MRLKSFKPTKQDITSQDINKRLEEVENQVKSTFALIQSTKCNLKKAIKAYKYLLDGAHQSEVEVAVKNQIEVLSKYDKKQQQLIDCMKQKRDVCKLVSISSKLPGLSDQIANALGQDQLLKLMVDIDLQIQQLQKRKEKLKDQFEHKKQIVK